MIISNMSVKRTNWLKIEQKQNKIPCYFNYSEPSDYFKSHNAHQISASLRWSKILNQTALKIRSRTH
jgi:hypothetical protein